MTIVAADDNMFKANGRSLRHSLVPSSQSSSSRKEAGHGDGRGTTIDE